MVAHPDPRQAPSDFDALLGGLHTTPALISHPGRQAGVQLSLTPLGARRLLGLPPPGGRRPGSRLPPPPLGPRRLLGLPAGELAALDCPPADVLGPAGAELTDRFRAARTWPERFAALERVL